jgi:ubiquitin-protein ligase
MALGPVKRLRKELQELQKEKDSNIVLRAQEDNIRLWKVSTCSIKGTPRPVSVDLTARTS